MGDYLGDFVFGNLFPQQLLAALLFVQDCFLIFEGGLQAGQFGIFKFGGQFQIAGALGLFDVAAGFFDLFPQALYR